MFALKLPKWHMNWATPGVRTVVFAFVFLFLIFLLIKLLPERIRIKVESVPFVAPAIFFVTFGLAVAAFRTTYISLFDDNSKKFVGLDNFKEIFTGDDTLLVVLNSLTWVVVGTSATVLVGLAVARFSDGMRGEKVWKSLIFIPAAISLVGAGIIWRFVYAGPPFKVGLLNSVTKGAHLPETLGGKGDRLWLLERSLGSLNPPKQWVPGFNTLLLIVIFIWAGAGFATVILSAAIKGVPQELAEAATVDGATRNQTFFRVTLPYIKSTIATVATITTLGGLKALDIVASSTGGDFGTSTIANEFDRVYFVQDRNGFGSALAVILFLMCFPVVILNRRIQNKHAENN